VPRYNDRPAGHHDLIRGLRRVVDAYPGGRLLVGEIYLPPARLMSYYGGANDEVHLPYNFQLLRLPWRAAAIGAAIADYERLLPPGAWPNWVLGNHDHHRIARASARPRRASRRSCC